MNICSQIESDSFLPSSTASSSSLILTTQSKSSPQFTQTHQTFFQTIKKDNRSQNKKRRYLFETSNIPECKSDQCDQVSKKQSNCFLNKKYRDNYLHLLISSVTSKFENGEVTLEYLNTPSYIKGPEISYSYLEEEKEIFSRKCENKQCAVVVDNPNNIYHLKFMANQSVKVHSQWLCDKCYKAFQLGNYCYYCNMIYREFSFNQQYYDRKKWIQCDYCQKWQHMQCEERKGKFSNIEELALNQNFKYMCPFCRKENEHLHKEHLLFKKSNHIFTYLYR